MTCAGCGADLDDLAVAFDRRHHPCCHPQAFATLSAACSDLASSISGLPASEREESVQKVLARLLAKPATEQLGTVKRARGYLRRSLKNAWIDEVRRRERAERKRLQAPPPPPPPPEEPTPDLAELAHALEDTLPAASLRLRGDAAQTKFVRLLRGLIDYHWREQGSREDLLAAEGLEAGAVNTLEKAQERARSCLICHLLEQARAARGAGDEDEAERLRGLARAVEGLKGPRRRRGAGGG